MSFFSGFRPPALTFLRSIKRNNRREWFHEHKDEYEEHLLFPMRALVEELDVRFAQFAPEIVGDAKRSIFRIHRDIRFSKDKSPYKTHIACWFSHQRAGHGVGSETHGAGAGYYFHLEPGESLVAGGIWMPPRPSLNRLREMIAERPAEFEKTIKAPSFRRRFKGLSDENMLTRLPRGFAPGHPAEPWLRFVSLTASARLSDADVMGKRLPDKIARDFQTMLPLVRWLNSALGYPPSISR